VSYISVEDVGLAAATILANPIGHESKTYLLSGPEAISQHELCDMLGSAVDEHLKLTHISFKDRFKYLTRKQLIPDWQVRGWEEVLKAAEKRNSPLQEVHRDIESICGVRAMPFPQWLSANVQYFRSDAPAVAMSLTGVSPDMRDALTRQMQAQSAVGMPPQPPPVAGLRAAVSGVGDRPSFADVPAELPGLPGLASTQAASMFAERQNEGSQFLSHAAEPLLGSVRCWVCVTDLKTHGFDARRTRGLGRHTAARAVVPAPDSLHLSAPLAALSIRTPELRALPACR
jgi:hypothetical protein